MHEIVVSPSRKLGLLYAGLGKLLTVDTLSLRSYEENKEEFPVRNFPFVGSVGKQERVSFFSDPISNRISFGELKKGKQGCKRPTIICS